jgi:hypothetical protein
MENDGGDTNITIIPQFTVHLTYKNSLSVLISCVLKKKESKATDLQTFK